MIVFARLYPRHKKSSAKKPKKAWASYTTTNVINKSNSIENRLSTRKGDVVTESNSFNSFVLRSILKVNNSSQLCNFNL